MSDISLQQLIGKGYKDFWNWRGRYLVCKGSRNSKKSVTAALRLTNNIMRYPLSNAVVVRKTFRTLKDSCFAQIKWAVHRQNVDHLWEFKESPLEAIYKPTGQKIYFRGLDDPLKVTSITVDVGYLCWMWIEEAYEITKESDFDMIDESIRGSIPNYLWKQIVFTFNPWNEHHWLKKRFFDDPDDETLAMTTNYMCNEFIDEADLKLFERMKVNNPRRYQVAGLGNWGIVEGLIYENWEEKDFSLKDVRNCATVCGLDFGYTNDPSALFVGFLDKENKKLYVWDEMYEKGLSNREISEKITQMGYRKEHITCDSAEPKSIDELKYLGLRATAAKKGKDSIKNGIQWIQDLKILIHPRCVNFLTEISNYTWDEDKFGNKVNEPIDDFNHLMDAMRYALEQYVIGNAWQLSERKLL